MKILMEKASESVRIQFRLSRFRKLVFKLEDFENFVSICGKFFEKPSLKKELRSTEIKFRRKKYFLYEEKRNNYLSGVIKIHKKLITWAFLCYIKEQLNEFSSSDQIKKEIEQDTH
ncbi:hypothetical protein NEF87_000895 [Candidatus Lokiarchaeum ossiferum]|uniref:Uncharacterized protein n=1 Tax=Candidatus Lokiarchaeum ossiferum TaxID=2951803 RepID=A0ABY6HM68_9ARCH|nr:hypothetical protein NEF87_000895 [Candidatus Lokiarchaeum sp. B-35]